MRAATRKWVEAGYSIAIELIGRKFSRLPLVAIIIVIVDPVINDCFDVVESLTLRQVNLILHMAEETLLRSIVSAVFFAGHRLPQATVFKNLDETQADIVAALVAMDQSFRSRETPCFCIRMWTVSSAKSSSRDGLRTYAKTCFV